MARQDVSADVWSDLTTGEADVLNSVLKAGADVAAAVDERGNHALFMETHRVIADIHEARRRRWNAEHPRYQIKPYIDA